MKTFTGLLFFFTLFNGVLLAQNEKTSYINLTGTVTGRTARVMTLSYADENEKKHEYTAQVKKGRFHFKFPLKSPVYGMLMGNGEKKSADESYAIEIFLSPGNMTVGVKGDSFQHVAITGSAMQDDVEKLQEQMKPIYRITDSLDKEINKLAAAGNTPHNHAAVMKIGRQVGIYEDNEKHIDYNFIKTHPTSYLSAFLLYNYLITREFPLDSALMFYNPLALPVKNSIAGLSAKKTLDYRKTSAPGAFAPLFSNTDISGKPLNLKSFLGKHYLILEFWGSYCIPQHEETRHLKQLYNKYHGKGLEIIGISFDFSKKEWEAAIAKDSTTIWHHVMATGAGRDDLWGLYDIRGLPPSLFILIDKNGRIAGRYRGKATFDIKNPDEGNIKDLDKKVIELMGR